MTVTTQSGRAAIVTVALMAAVAIIDGFDTQAFGPAAKAIAEELGFAVAKLGPLFSASQVGFLIGAATLGAAGDRFGRKRILIAATILFAICALATAYASGYWAIFAARLIGGIGLGGATPNFVSLAAAAVTPARRTQVVTMMWAAVPLGGMASALFASWAIPRHGWRLAFEIGAVAPLVLCVLLWLFLREPPEAASLDGGVARERTGHALFGDGRLSTTAALWVASFLGWMSLVVTVFWSPALLSQAGVEPSVASALLAVHNVGGIVGTLLIGLLLGRLQPHVVLAVALAASGLATIGIALGTTERWLLVPAMASAGFFGSASAAALIAISSQIYPDAARARGVGFALAVGRLGTVVGPSLVGILVAASWSTPEIYRLISIPAFAAAVTVIFLARTRGYSNNNQGFKP